MEVVEMLDNLKEKARRDPHFVKNCWQHVRRKNLWQLSAESAGSWAFRFMRWILLRQARNFTQL